MSQIAIAALIAVNLGLIFLALAAPLGIRTVRSAVVANAPRERAWQALWPFGRDAGWSAEVVAAEPVDREPSQARLKIGWDDREGLPIERLVELEDIVEGERFSMRIVDDSSLDPAFWRHYRESATLVDRDGGTEITLTQTDHYRGLAFLVFRFFALRRKAAKLKIWMETGEYRKGGAFERPTTQIALAALSTFLIWPLFGLTAGGFAIAACLTAVVALHELGHLAAFRLMGHRNVRMIFIPLLGGIAIGGRPYDSRFEVAFVALMGAGFSAFLVPLAIMLSDYAAAADYRPAATLLAVFAGCAALFNIANLVPVWKFDGGQVLRQLFSSQIGLAVASFVMLAAFLGVAFAAGFSGGMLVAGAAIFVVLSLITTGSGVKPRRALKPIRTAEKAGIAAALVAVFVVHGSGLLWAAEKWAAQPPPLPSSERVCRAA
ncbi:site-2 protease family protein [Mesorhizobium sp. ZC-5]|uniref:site-2 protease family protein n=1 Tax=Mesorhizobium sp. ZC-5 TaxID=2986066 RepID=UPI0021E7EC80|nr:site-2 protease family protein [Mesorhizobium sp. ZC-5]MCV3240398.1 site-2 protease family protein [Mesorhizobium sp. ZC-5]